jgi:manganese/zinc/iron transport system permease protein
MNALLSIVSWLALDDPSVRRVLIGSALFAAGSALVGTFALLRRRALVGDAISHAVLPGICVAYLVQGSKEPLGLLVGAFITGALSLAAVDYLARRTRIREDAALALVLSVAFGIGIVLLSGIQQSGSGTQSGLDRFLFGKAAALTDADLYTFGALAVVLTLAVVLLRKEFTLLAFDPIQARVLGLPTRALEAVLSGLIVLAVVLGVQAVGVVLMAGMLFAPAAAARYWSHRVGSILILAAIFGMLSGVGGTYLSLTAAGMPTGPWMIVSIAAIVLLSMALAPERGLLPRAYARYRRQRTMNEENILKTLYLLNETSPEHASAFAEADLRQRNAPLARIRMQWALHRLQHRQHITRHGTGWQLTDAGALRARRLVRLHRLWEVYLTQRLRLAPDHVHDDAETIEHLLTPELELELARILDRPKADPHNRAIPY